MIVFYTWQRCTQLAGITGNGKNISYVYDSQGKRVQKTVNDVVTTYLYSDDMLMRQTDGTNTIDFQYDAGGQIIGFVYNGTPYYYLRNIMNDVSGIVDANGTVVAKYRYDAYGNTIYSTGSMAEINPIRYRGYYFDAETSWYYLESRYYNPEWRRFINSDSLFIAGDAITGSNMYTYCNGDPISYVDPSGMISEKDYKIGNAIRVASKVTSWVLLPATVLVVSPVSNMLLDEVKDKLGDEPLENSIVQDVVSGLNYGAYEALGKHTTPISGNTYNVPTGLRHFMPVNMAFGAPWAAYFLGFEEDENCPSIFTAYTTVSGKPMWQSRVGYDTIYDSAFSLGGPIYRQRYKFTTGTGENTKYFVVWIWKGDYWNLGAGAEIGIYVANTKEQYDNNFYEVDENLVLDVNMDIKYRTLNGLLPLTLNNLTQRNWWVCSFSPAIQHPNVNWIDVNVKANFVTNGDYDADLLMTAFYENGNRAMNEEHDWEEVTWAPTQRKTGRTEYCDKHPTQCVCDNAPCREYSDNGYQFYIEYKNEEITQ